MQNAYLFQYIGLSILILILILLMLIRKDIRKFVPVGLFAIVYANIWCYFAEYFKLWNYPTRLFPKITIVSIPFNYALLPILVMVWMMFCPSSVKGKIAWALVWSSVIVGVEFMVTRYTPILQYTNGFDIHISFVLWNISWFIFLKFHKWVNNINNI